MAHIYDHGGNIFSVARQRGFSATESIDFSASINPLGLSANVKNAISTAIDSLIHYPDNSCGELKQTLAEIHGLTAEHFSIANGSTETIYNLPAMIRGKKALIVSPAFSEYAYALQQHHWEVRHFILSADNDFDLDLNQLEAALEEGYDALYICNPGNPSGKLFPPETITEIYRLCGEFGTFMVLDEAFIDFCPESSAAEEILKGEHGIVLRSMTKFYGFPGLRLGYALAVPSLISRLSAMGGPWSVNTLAQAAGLAALRDKEYAASTLTYMEAERKRMFSLLSGIEQITPYPSRANFLLSKLNNAMTASELKEQLMQSRILIRDCSTFTGLSSQFFRVAIKTTAENDKLIHCLKETFA